MKDECKKKEQLINELEELRQQISELKGSEAQHKQAEEVLVENEEKYPSLADDVLDTTNVGIFILNSDFQVVWMNQALERYFGIRRTEVLGKDKRQLIRERIKNVFVDPERFTEKVFATYDNNTYVENFECHVLPDSDREERWLQHWSQPIKTGLYTGGRIEHYTDITERKQVEEALKESEERYHKLIETANDAIFIANSETGIIFDVNKKAEELLGIPTEEIIGMHQMQLHPKEEAERYRKIFIDHIQRGKAITGDLFVCHKNGRSIPVEISASVTKVRGKKIIQGIFRDVTERKRTEEEKAKIDARLKNKVTELSIINEISEVLLSSRELNEILHMILIGATANQALGFNRAFLFLINDKENILEGKVATGSLSAEEAYKIWERLALERHTLKELIKSRHGELSKEDEPMCNLVKQMKIPLMRKESIFTQALYEKKSFNILNGRQHPLIDRDFINLLGTDAFALVPLISRGKPLGVLLADNFTNQKPINDEDVERLRAFANHASLAIENSHLYKRLEEKVEELSDAYNEIRENRDKLIRYERLSAVGKVAAQITHEIRNPLVSIGGFARRILKKNQDDDVNRKYAEIIVEEIDHLENILTEILCFAKPAVPKRNTVDLNSIIKKSIEVLNLEIKKNNINVEKHLDLDLPMLWLDEDQIKRVLINLIRNAIDAMPGGGNITISTISENQCVKVGIADTGIGISEDDIDKLFDAFFTNKSTGSGLGLTISAQIINNHGGIIEAQKRKPKGTIFTIQLPIPEETGKQERITCILRKREKARILVIEDKEEVRQFIREILTEDGHEVEIASDGNHGIEMFGKKEFDLVFTDLGMPGMSGWQVAEKIKGLNRRVPVSVITGWNVELKESEMKEKGVDFVIKKPFKIYQLLNLVQEGMILRNRFKAA